VFPKIFLLHKVVRDAKKVEKHCSMHIRVFPHNVSFHLAQFTRRHLRAPSRAA